jgi:hypothetical protein
MLSALNKQVRGKAAIVLAVVYALCVLAPSATFAVAAPAAIAHCLQEDHGFVAPAHHEGATHQHTDGTAHEHDGDHAAITHADNGHEDHGKSCCGLLSAVGITGDPPYTIGALTVASLLLPVLPGAMSGRSPERINRPPIA